MPGNRRLVAYVVPRAPATPSASELRRFLQDLLPDYMLPSAWVFLESLPLSANGKVERRALPAPDAERGGGDKAFVKPRTPIEQIVADIWAEVLGLERVGIQDNFFDLGGHSLLATGILARVYDFFRVEIPVRRMFEAPTVCALAETLARLLAETVGQDKLAQLLAQVEDLSEEQTQRLLQQLD
jgi:acyl carrier protein